jgi:hypothetical protein
MTKSLEMPVMQFELPDGLDYIFDNTPVSSEDMTRITEMIQNLKLEDNKFLPADENLHLGDTPMSESDRHLADEYVQKSKAQIKRQERLKVQKLA